MSEVYSILMHIKRRYNSGCKYYYLCVCIINNNNLSYDLR